MQVHVFEHPRGFHLQTERHADLPAEVALPVFAFFPTFFVVSQGIRSQAIHSSGQIQERRTGGD